MKTPDIVDMAGKCLYCGQKEPDPKACLDNGRPCDFEVMLVRVLRNLRENNALKDWKVRRLYDVASDLLMRKGRSSPLKEGQP